MFSTIVIALAASTASVLAAPGLSVSFSGASATDVDNFKVVTTLTNTGDETLNLLNDPNSLHTPSWKTQMFNIASAEGVAPGFKGVRVKYAPKIAAANKEYTTIAPGQSLDFTHVLGGVYNFTSSGESAYTITPSTEAQRFTHVNAAGELTTLLADVSDAHTAKLAGKLAPSAYVGHVATAGSVNKRANSFVSCSSSRQSLLTTAASNAQTYANSAYSYAAGISSGTTRYVTWFGTYSASNKATIQSHYNNIKNGQLATDTFDCTCTDSGTYAYVYPDTFGYIYLCGAFWNAPATGTDSKAGTLIHESSHFTKNGGTQDYVYGQTGAKSLAKSNPSQAIFNADSHEYFAENTPAQS